MGHRTSARLMSKGVTNGMYNGKLSMDTLPYTAMLGTCSVDSIAADSANTASAYMTGHKSSVNALGVYADRTPDSLDDPRPSAWFRTPKSRTRPRLPWSGIPAAAPTRPKSWICSTA